MKLFNCILVMVLLVGCAGPGVQFKDNGDSIIISPHGNEGIFAFLFGGLNAGNYSCQFSEHKKASFDTKKDMKIIDINMAKLGGE